MVDGIGLSVVLVTRTVSEINPKFQWVRQCRLRVKSGHGVKYFHADIITHSMGTKIRSEDK